MANPAGRIEHLNAKKARLTQKLEMLVAKVRGIETQIGQIDLEITKLQEPPQEAG